MTKRVVVVIIVVVVVVLVVVVVVVVHFRLLVLQYLGRWFVSLILCAFYTANMAAFMTAAQIASPIKDVHELIAQNKIKYGTVADSAASDFINQSAGQARPTRE